MAVPPLCETCGTRHHSYQGHVFPATPSRVTQEVKEAPATKHDVVPMRSSIAVKHAGAVELGKRGGLVGGKVRAARLSPERRAEIARAAALARWGRLA